ncbi:hypothetical protein [Rhodovibrio salinarum]|uniref:Uncharacterized protein n=1 Tax=Rhodovibrio salinarum TaxID=1087 RepID=A0A934UZ23_9PROT|nr:hypothetical protein [Rhodovibrio salinarum]MBK1696642.1 hypothetical protein [Rhodovibrio salinarum]
MNPPSKAWLRYRCQECDADLPGNDEAHDLKVRTCPNCGTACDIEGSAARRGNARAAKKVVRTGLRAVMYPFA